MTSTAVIGFGEAGQTFARGGLRVCAGFDLRADRCGDLQAAGIVAASDAVGAVEGADLILSLVTADQAEAAAAAAAPGIKRGALFLDMNSVAPETKRAAARAVMAAGGCYFDVAVMAPVNPARLAVPLLVSGAGAGEGVAALLAAGFTNVRAVGEEVGRASAIKMIRSVMVKGIEALTDEMMQAAAAAGVADEVLASLGDGWEQRAAYNLERMAAHGARRAAEMEESARTLAALGVEPVMTSGTVLRQRAAAVRKDRAA